jgi:hypothetical protein
MNSTLGSLLNNPTISRVRRNHGLEHATIHVLAEKNPKRSIAGHSDVGGFWLLGEVTAGEVKDASSEALHRLQGGESSLAIHPNCGTNLVTSSMAAGVAGALAMSGTRSGRDRLERLPLAGLLAMAALLMARPLGTRVQQRITTSGEPGELEIVDISETQRAGLKAFRVTTRG